MSLSTVMVSTIESSRIIAALRTVASKKGFEETLLALISSAEL